MRLSSQNNSFIFNFPINFLNKRLNDKFEKLLIKNFIPYENTLDYINSTIKEISIPGLKFDGVEQTLMRGKKYKYKEAQNIHDKSSHDVDITFRSIDNNLNYMFLREIMTDFYLENKISHIPFFSVEIIDKNGDLIYTILFRDILLNEIDNLQLGYNKQDFSEQTYNFTFSFNFMDIFWELDTDQEKNIYDIPITFKKLSLDKL